MTIAERINLHRCGYSRAEIDALAAAEKEELETVEAEPVEQRENPEPTSAQPDRSADILAAINNLTAALQRQNVNTQQQPAPQQVTMTDIINSI